MYSVPNLGRMTTLILFGAAIIGCASTGTPADEHEWPAAVIRPDTWFIDLPASVRASIIWIADHEEGDLSDWEDAGTDTYYAGGGVFNTGSSTEAHADLRTDIVHTGDFAVSASITGAIRAENGTRAVRLMRWTNAPWNEDGDYFPREAYYSVWAYLPERYDPRKFEPWDTGDGGWWNIFQFKSDNDAGSQPVAVLNLWWNDETRRMEFYLDTKHYPDPSSDEHENTTWEQTDPIEVPIGEWFHLEARFVKSRIRTGSITIWQNGVQILRADNVITELSEQTTWGIGNYTDHIQAIDIDGNPVGTTGSATVFFDDAAVSLVPVHPYH